MWLGNVTGDLTPKPRRSAMEALPKRKPRRKKGCYFTGISFPENGGYLNHRPRPDYFSLELEH